MSEHIFIILWIGAMALLSSTVYLKKKEVVLGKEKMRFTWEFAILMFVPIVVMAGTRGYVADTTAYIKKYLNMPESFLEIPNYIATETKDTGFYFFSSILHVLFKDNYTIYLTILAIIQGISLLKLYRKYSPDFVLSIFLFVASSDYYSWMYNGLRQFIAVTIILLVTPHILRQTSNPLMNKYIPIIIIILFASTFHQSALLMFVFILIAQGKAWNKRTLMFIVGVLLAITFLDKFTDILDSTLESTQYENVVSDYIAFEDDGTNPLRVLVYSVPALISFIGRKQIYKYKDPLINFCTNMAIISSGLYVISMFTSGIFIGRLPIYCSLYGYILLPWELNYLFTKKSKELLYIMLIMLYLIFYYYQMHYTWNLI